MRAKNMLAGRCHMLSNLDIVLAKSQFEPRSDSIELEQYLKSESVSPVSLRSAHAVADVKAGALEALNDRFSALAKFAAGFLL